MFVFQELLVAADVVKTILDRCGIGELPQPAASNDQISRSWLSLASRKRQLSRAALCSPGGSQRDGCLGRLPWPGPIDSMSEIVRNGFGAGRSEVANERDGASSDKIEN